ncbi:10388_t:CDS:2 [Dentiscutata erythropus]|uniref:10388_t:CDS:1 n=1 Tax=Dentiscutata erythropus TaxID=1348616 RepID=A0A9N9HPX9_9GLOM|nr:10388_t:CDS:2 [Dentiscutata erythropus]
MPISNYLRIVYVECTRISLDQGDPLKNSKRSGPNVFLQSISFLGMRENASPRSADISLLKEIRTQGVLAKHQTPRNA